MKPRVSSLVGLGRAVGSATLFVVLTAGASAQYWTPTVGGNWNVDGSWSSTAPPTTTATTFPNAAGAAVTISTNIGAAVSIPLGVEVTIGTLSIGDTNNTHGFTLGATGGPILTLDNGASAASITAVAGSISQTIAAPLSLLSSTTNISNLATSVTTGTRTLTLSGAISSGSAGNKEIAFSSNIASSQIAATGVISNGPSGTVSVSKAGANGILILSGNNSYSGGTTLTAGTLYVNHASALGTGVLTISGGTIGSTAGSAISINNAVTWGANVAVGGTQTLTLAGTQTLTGSRSIALTGAGTLPVNVSNLAISGVIDDGVNTYNLTTTGGPGIGAVLTLSGANTYGGTTNVNGGLVRFANTGALPSNGAGSLSIGASGAVSVSGIHTTIAGWVSDSRLATSSTGALALQGTSSSENFDASATGTNYQTLSIGADTTASVNYTGTITPGSTGYYVGGGGGTITFSNANAFTGANAVTVGNGGGGKVIVNNSNDYTGRTTVKAGTTLNIQNSSALGLGDGTAASDTTVAAGGGVELQGNVTINGELLTVNGTNSNATIHNVTAGLSNLSGNNVWNGAVNAIVTAGNNARLSITAGTLDIKGTVTLSGAGTGESLVLTGNGGTATISGAIAGTNAQTIIKNGNSAWVLSGASNFTGGVRIDGGSLSVATINSVSGGTTTSNLGAPSNPTRGIISFGESTSTGTLIYTGTGETTDRGLTLRSTTTGATAGGAVIDQSGSGLLKFTGAFTSAFGTANSSKLITLQGSTAGTGEISGVISNGVNAAIVATTNIVKTGTGTWTLSGNNTYSGSTSVTNGTLTVTKGADLTGGINSTTSLSVANGKFVIGGNEVVNDAAPVGLGANSVLQVTGFTEGLGALTVTGSSILDLLGDNNNVTFVSGNITGAGLLDIINWNGNTGGEGAERVIFSSTVSIASQLSKVTFTNPTGLDPGVYSAKFIGNELVPDALIPEPSAVIAFLSGAALLGVRRRRQ